MLSKLLGRRAYLLIITNLYCNHRCSYCIQQESSLDVRLNPKRIDVPAVLAFLRKNRVDDAAKVMGGEATLHPDFELLMDGLVALMRKVVLTTNVNGKWYEDFDGALEKMKAWGRTITWNTTYHPAWMDVDLYIERVRAMQAAGVKMMQITATDTPELSDEQCKKLASADIGWTLQPFTGRAADGRLLPETWDDVRAGYPLLYHPSRYIENHPEYERECEDANQEADFERKEWVDCTTSRFLIGPDNLVYPCHRHLYAEDPRYACGSIHDVEMKDFRHKWDRLRARWVLPCDTKCNPCDFKVVHVRPTGRAVRGKAEIQRS